VCSKPTGPKHVISYGFENAQNTPGYSPEQQLKNTNHTLAITKIKKENAIYELWLVPPKLDMSGKHILLQSLYPTSCFQSN
jgi:hypothetical protein